MENMVIGEGMRGWNSTVKCVEDCNPFENPIYYLAVLPLHWLSVSSDKDPGPTHL